MSDTKILLLSSPTVNILHHVFSISYKKTGHILAICSSKIYKFYWNNNGTKLICRALRALNYWVI